MRRRMGWTWTPIEILGTACRAVGLRDHWNASHPMARDIHKSDAVLCRVHRFANGAIHRFQNRLPSVSRFAPVFPGMLAYGVLAALTRDFVTDDALITLRYARHWASGLGITWNALEDPVEGFTSFSHVALGALAIRAGLPALTVLRLLNVIGALGLIAATYALAWRLLRSRGWACVAALMVGAHPALAYWSVSGLDTSSYACAVLVAIWAIDSGKRWWACTVFLIAALTRFEGPAVVVAVSAPYVGLAVVWGGATALRDHARWLIVWSSLYGGYFAWRYAYFGHLLSNSAYFKAGGSASGTLVWDFLAENAALLLLVPLARWRGLGAAGIALAAALGLYLAAYYRVLPFVSYMHRFFLPVYAPAVLLAVSALHGLSNAFGRATWSKVLAGGVVALALGWDLSSSTSGLTHAISEATAKRSRMVSRVRVAAFIAESYPASTRVAVGDGGVVGYALLNPLIDTFGLNDERFTHRFGRHRRAYTGFVLTTRPDLVVVVSKDRRRFVPRYKTDEFLVTHRPFRRYRHVHTIESPVEPYHYFVYAGGWLTSRITARPVVRESPNLGSLIDEFAQAVWSMQRGEHNVRTSPAPHSTQQSE